MHPLQFAVPLGPLEATEPYITHVVLVLVLANMATRFLAHRTHVRQATDGAEAIRHYPPHVVTTLLLVLASFTFLLLHPHGGMVLSVLVLGMFVSDLFELEARKVEARNDLDVERPKGALTASAVVLLYAAYQSLFFVVAPIWNKII